MKGLRQDERDYITARLLTRPEVGVILKASELMMETKRNLRLSV